MPQAVCLGLKLKLLDKAPIKLPSINHLMFTGIALFVEIMPGMAYFGMSTAFELATGRSHCEVEPADAPVVDGYSIYDSSECIRAVLTVAIGKDALFITIALTLETAGRPLNFTLPTSLSPFPVAFILQASVTVATLLFLLLSADVLFALRVQGRGSNRLASATLHLSIQTSTLRSRSQLRTHPFLPPARLPSAWLSTGNEILRTNGATGRPR